MLHDFIFCATQLALLNVSLISEAIDTATSYQLRGLVMQAPASPPQIHEAMSAKVSGRLRHGTNWPCFILKRTSGHFCMLLARDRGFRVKVRSRRLAVRLILASKATRAKPDRIE